MRSAFGDVTLLTEEERREKLVRTFACPRCHARKGHMCTWGLNKLGGKIAIAMSHTGRYRLAAQAGLVPELP